MSFFKQLLGDFAGHVAPGGTLDRVRFRVGLNMLRNNAITVLAIALAIGYQVLLHWGHRILGSR